MDVSRVYRRHQARLLTHWRRAARDVEAGHAPDLELSELERAELRVYLDAYALLSVVRWLQSPVHRARRRRRLLKPLRAARPATPFTSAPARAYFRALREGLSA